jgi:hypothetical protein
LSPCGPAARRAPPSEPLAVGPGRAQQPASGRAALSETRTRTFAGAARAWLPVAPPGRQPVTLARDHGTESADSESDSEPAVETVTVTVAGRWQCGRRRRRGLRVRVGPRRARRTATAWKSQKVMLHSKLKRPTISTHFQSPSEGVGKCDFRVLPLAARRLKAFQTTKEVTAARRTL